MNTPVFLVLFIIIIALITIFPLLLRRLYIPGVIALLIAGMLIGEHQLNVIHYLCNWLSLNLGGVPADSEAHFRSFIDSLGSLGLIFLMALAGMEADFKLLRSARKPVIALSILTFALPAIAGYFVFAFFNAGDLPGKLLYASLFASHSVGIVFPVMRELQLSRTRFGAAVLISTVMTDISSIILLAVSVQLKKLEIGEVPEESGLSFIDNVATNMGQWFLPFFISVVIFFIIVSSVVIRRLCKRIIHHIGLHEDMLITFLLLVILATVLIGECIGINLIVSAFIAGLALSSLLKKEGLTSGVFFKFEGIGYGLLIPFLFISIGMQTDLSVIFSPGNLAIVLLTIFGLVGSKVISGWLALRLTGFDNVKGMCAGLMTVPQLSATLAAAAVGKSLNMLDSNFFNAIVILSIVTTIPIPSLVRGLIAHYKPHFDSIDAEAYDVPAPEAKEDDIL